MRCCVGVPKGIKSLQGRFAVTAAAAAELVWRSATRALCAAI
jgi:hypothetical protein